MKYKRLFECADFSDKRTKSISLESYISTENMLPNKGGITLAESIPDSSSASKYEPQDILLSNIRPYFCKIWYANKEGSCSNDVLVLKAKKEYDSKFLYYVLSDINFFNYDTVTSKGTKMPRGSKKAIMKYLVPDIDIKEQRRVASILSTYDNLIENNNKRIRLLEQMAENLYKEWFVRFRFPGHEKAEFENGLPKGWKREKIGKVYNTCSGGTPSRVNEDFYNNGSIPWVKTGELQDCLIHDAEEFITEDALKRSSAKLLPNHSLLMAMYGVNIGKLGILRKEMTCNQAVCAFLPKTADQTFYYLYFYLKGIRNYLLSISFGAAQQNLSQALIKNVRIMIPHNDTLQKFENKVSCYFDQISIYQRQNEQLARQRDLLLPRLMSGKLEVNI